MPQCRLCLEDKKLVKSHIIPKFMFKKMKDGDNVFYEVLFNLATNESKYKKTQIEDYDKNILCENCDNAILGGSYEKYFEKVMYGENLPYDIAPRCTNYKNPNDGTEYSICKNINYTKLKLFLLSILWRSSITDRPYFENVSIGYKHEERLREIIYTGEHIPFDEYPVIITSFLRTDNKLDNLIAQPKRIRTKSGLNGYMFLINSFQFIMYVNAKNHKVSKEIEEICLKEDELITLHLSKGEELEFIKMLLN